MGNIHSKALGNSKLGLHFCSAASPSLITQAYQMLSIYAMHSFRRTASKLPYILESNPNPFYSFRGLKNQMRIRFVVVSWILEK